MSMTTNKQALREDRVKWLEKLSDLEYCKSNPGHWLMSLSDTVLLANLALDSVNLRSKLEAAERRNADMAEFIRHVKKCLVKNGEYSPLSHETIDTILGVRADGISITATTDKGE